MSASEILGWMKYYEDNPFSSDRLDWIIMQNSIIISDVRNINRGKGKRSKVEEFLPPWLSSKMKSNNKSLQQQKEEALAWAAKYKGK